MRPLSNLLCIRVLPRGTPCHSRCEGLPWQRKPRKRSRSCTRARPAREKKRRANSTIKVSMLKYLNCHNSLINTNQLHSLQPHCNPTLLKGKPQGKSLKLGPPSVGKTNWTSRALCQAQKKSKGEGILAAPFPKKASTVYFLPNQSSKCVHTLVCM